MVSRSLSDRRRSGDPLRAPDITVNAWRCPPFEGCSVDTLQAAVEAQAAAGIMVVVGADSAGPNCSRMENPPSIYAASYTVGCVDYRDNVASFSSRGPVIICRFLWPLQRYRESRPPSQIPSSGFRFDQLPSGLRPRCTSSQLHEHVRRRVLDNRLGKDGSADSLN